MSEATKGVTLYSSAKLSQQISSINETILDNWTTEVSAGITVGSTNVFTTPTAGWYLLSYSFEIQANSSTSSVRDLIFRIKRDGTGYHVIREKDLGDPFSVDSGGSILIQMTSGQTITITSEVQTKADSDAYTFSGYCSLVKVG